MRHRRWMEIELNYMKPGESWWRGQTQEWVVTRKRVDNTILCVCLDDGFTAHFRNTKRVAVPY